VERPRLVLGGAGDARMQRVALIYNPMSGQRPGRREKLIADVVAVLRQAGIEVGVFPTTAPESAGPLALQAMAEGCDTILACGGDGTVHEALQTMVDSASGTKPQVALGVIPMGTANALAIDLGLPGSPVKAAKMLLKAQPRRISVGQVTYRDSRQQACSRYFVVAAGIGADGLFFSRLDSKLKQRFGYAAYLIEALRMAFTHSFPMFRAAFTGTGGGAQRAVDVSQLLAVRISDFGGLVNQLVPGASIANPNLHALAFKTRSRWRYLQFMAAVMTGRHKYCHTIELVECTALPATAEPLFVEADGEYLGTLPVRIEVVPNALTLLMPKKKKTLR
jgi:YegS/Rv2252/BmrU family lipid kinase